MSYALKIRHARSLLGWSQMVLAERANLSVETIKRIECGKGATELSLRLIEDAFEREGIEFESALHEAVAPQDTR